MKTNEKNACLRKAIWNKYSSSDELNLDEIEIDVNSKDGDIKKPFGVNFRHICRIIVYFNSDRKKL